MSDEATTSGAPHSWPATAVALVALCLGTYLCVALLMHHLDSRITSLLNESENAVAVMRGVLTDNRIPPESIIEREVVMRETDQALWYAFDVDVLVPEEVNADGLESVLRRSMAEADVEVSDYLEDGVKRGVSLFLGEVRVATVRLISKVPSQAPLRPAPLPEVPMLEEIEPPAEVAPEAPAVRTEVVSVEEPSPAASPRSARLAIIVDDGGYGGEVARRVLALTPALTLAILPYTPHGESFAVEAAKAGFEIMAHMPMENIDPDLTHEGQLTTEMEEGRINQLAQAALDQIPGAVGINNHEGSKFTADARAMSIFMEFVRARGLFFVDSRTVAGSRAYQIAQAFGVPSIERDFFLDHVNDPDAIRRSFSQALQAAKDNGVAVAIGHFRPNTVMVLEEMLPLLESEGVDLVHVSELIQ